MDEIFESVRWVRENLGAVPRPIQVLVGVLKLGKFIRLVPHPVMLGFVNGLAIIIALYRHRESLNPDAFTSLKW